MTKIAIATPANDEPALNVPPGWMQLSSGKGIDLLNPSPKDINWNDIATSLSLLCRYTGHMADLDSFFSVAQHSVLVADLMHPSIAVYGLLHDCHEAFWGDDATPKKRALAKDFPEAARWLEGCKALWDFAIWEAAGVPPPTPDILRAVHDADYLALAIEHKCLQRAPADDMTRAAWKGLPDAKAFQIVALPPRRAHELFLDRLNTLLWPTHYQEGVA